MKRFSIVALLSVATLGLTVGCDRSKDKRTAQMPIDEDKSQSDEGNIEQLQEVADENKEPSKNQDYWTILNKVRVWTIADVDSTCAAIAQREVDGSLQTKFLIGHIPCAVSGVIPDALVHRTFDFKESGNLDLDGAKEFLLYSGSKLIGSMREYPEQLDQYKHSLDNLCNELPAWKAPEERFKFSSNCSYSVESGKLSIKLL